MHVTVQVDEQTGKLLQAAGGQSAAPEVRILMDCVQSFGGSLRAVHPGTSDSELMRFFQVDVRDSTQADAVLAALRGCRGVRAAYVKPPDAPPL